MTKIKLCGLSRPCDIETANQLLPEYIGFVFSPTSKRYVTPEQAAVLRKGLHPAILPVGVFVDEPPENVAALRKAGIIGVAQLHGREDEAYIRRLRELTDQPIVKAFRIDTERDAAAAQQSSADYVLLDSGVGGTGTTFDWTLIRSITRPYFLAGGLDPNNVTGAVETLAPYAVDVSSGIETNGVKDSEKMEAFVQAVRHAKGKDE